MKILHYTLGLPPVRRGGLINYSISLMSEQAQLNNNEITLLYPSVRSIFNRKGIKFKKIYKRIKVYQFTSSIPIPLLDGVKNPCQIITGLEDKLKKQFIDFIRKSSIEIFHIHTFMGLHLDLLKEIKNLRIKIIYSTHDYYGLCPKVNLINQFGDPCYDLSGNTCMDCNSDAMSTNLQVIRDSSLLHKLKPFMRKIKSNIKSTIKRTYDLGEKNEKTKQGFVDLFTFYRNCFILIDKFHFNSELTRSVYIDHLPEIIGEVIPITHSGIKDKRSEKSINKNQIIFGFIGDTGAYKGYGLLLEALNKLLKSNERNWKLLVYSNNYRNPNNCELIINEGTYRFEEIEKVFSKIDLLIVPSIWKETFSFIALEAISFGVPVLVSDNVGAKDIVKKYDCNFVFKPTIDNLFEKLTYLLNEPDQIKLMNQKICNMTFDFEIKIHADEIFSRLYI